jgi:hypothetical protein
MVSVSPKDEKNEVAKTLETRSIFVSHTHADRQLANALGDLAAAVFSGLVVPFTSSDPGATRGLMPGEEWFERIHVRLREAEAVWVLATPQSITRPWIYWEAGTGRALCPGSVVVVRVGLQASGVPSPLSAFQSYDGLSSGDDGIGVMLNKVAAQIGMKLAPVLVDKYVADWIAVAKAHEPDEEGTESPPSVSPEQLDRLEAIIARLEAVVAAPATPPSAARRSRGARPQGPEPGELFADIETLIAAVNAEQAPASFNAVRIDQDGDAQVMVTSGAHRVIMWLHSSALPHLTARTDVPARTAKLIDEIIQLRDAKERTP